MNAILQCVHTHYHTSSIVNFSKVSIYINWNAIQYDARLNASDAKTAGDLERNITISKDTPKTDK